MATKTKNVHRAVHQLPYRAGKAIEPGTIITDAISKAAKLSADDLDELVERGAVETVEVLVEAAEPAKA